MVAGGTVHDAIIEANKQYKDGLDKIDCVHYFKDVLLALEFIHRKGIVHNDVKGMLVSFWASCVFPDSSIPTSWWLLLWKGRWFSFKYYVLTVPTPP